MELEQIKNSILEIRGFASLKLRESKTESHSRFRIGKDVSDRDEKIERIRKKKYSQIPI